MESNHTGFKVIVLPDDPALSPDATRKRAFKARVRWSRAGTERLTPRSLTKNHQTHHLVTREGVSLNG